MNLQAGGDFTNRAYVGAGLLMSQLEPDPRGVEGLRVDDSESTGASVLLGYDINERLTLEGHLADLGESTFSPDGAIGYQVGGLSGIVYGFNSQTNRQQRQGLSVFGRIGVGALNNEADGVRYKRVNDVHLLAGAGVEYSLTQGLSARLELIGHETDARFAQLALLYRFGASDRQPANPVTADEFDTAVAVTTDDASTNSGSDATVLQEDDRQPAQAADSARNELSDEAGGSIDACSEASNGETIDSAICDLFAAATEGVHFRINSAELTAGAENALEQTLQALKDNPDIKVTIEAHTDNAGNAEDNLQLSRRRALTVARFLVNAGVSGLRLRPQAFGESRPRQSNATREGRAANRRVEFTVLR
ncbi:MAG: OmpA family protein [Granulosicoccus sp.]